MTLEIAVKFAAATVTHYGIVAVSSICPKRFFPHPLIRCLFVLTFALFRSAPLARSAAASHLLGTRKSPTNSSLTLSYTTFPRGMSTTPSSSVCKSSSMLTVMPGFQLVTPWRFTKWYRAWFGERPNANDRWGGGF